MSKGPRPVRGAIGKAVLALAAVAMLGSASAAAPTTAAARASATAAVVPPPEGNAGETLSVAPSQNDGSWTAKLLTPAKVHREPDVDRSSFMTVGVDTRYSKGPTQLLVRAAQYGPDRQLMLEVVLPRRQPRTGWIAARDAVLLSNTSFIVVRRATRTVELWVGGRRRLRAKAVIGAANTPTPAGLYAIYEAVKSKDDRAFIGPWALHLTAFSPTLDRFGSGDGRIALHGRGPSALGDPLGSARSHGCVRLNNRVIARLLDAAPPGTPVLIR